MMIQSARIIPMVSPENGAVQPGHFSKKELADTAEYFSEQVSLAKSVKAPATEIRRMQIAADCISDCLNRSI